MSNCTKTKFLMEEILYITSKIRIQFPELYVLLNETPQLYSAPQNCLFVQDLEYYLNSITKQLKSFQKNENNKL